MFDINTQAKILLNALPMLSKITAGYSTLTDSKGRMITNFDHNGKEITQYKGQVYEMALNCLLEGKPVLGPAYYDENCTALAIPIGDNVLVTTNTQRVLSEASLKQAITKSLTFIGRIVGGSVSVCDKNGDHISSCDSNGNPITISTPSVSAKKALKTMKPIVNMSNKIEGVQNVYIPITGDCCLVLNNEVAIIKSNKLLEEVRKHQSTRYNFSDIIGQSIEIQQTILKSKKIANSNSTVMLFGDTGTGKEMFSQSIHNYSTRTDKPFIALNCAALPASLIESNLFGYEGGAFTGAKKGGMPGCFEQANGGTIFLDEISEMDLNSQSKLLRVIQEKQVTRIGGSKPIPVDVRIICATNKDLLESVKQKKFREDLYYRLNVIHINIPPLNNRIGDIPLLIDYFIKKYNFQIGKSVIKIDDDALRTLEAYQWPGNIRELENCIEYAVNMVDYTEDVIKSIHLPRNFQSKEEMSTLTNYTLQNDNKSLKCYVEDYEKVIITQMVDKLEGNTELIAQKLGISNSTLWRKMKRYKLI